MLVGLVFGAFYCVSVFRSHDVIHSKQKRCGPLLNGYLNVYGYYVYHWMVAIPLSLFCLIMSEYNLFGFSLIMFFHGLIFSSKYCNKKETVNVAIDVDNISETFEAEEEGSKELIDVSDNIMDDTEVL